MTKTIHFHWENRFVLQWYGAVRKLYPTFSLPGLLRFQWAKCSTVRHFLRVYLPLLNVDKDILFLLAIRKREHKVSTNKQYTHSALVLKLIDHDVMHLQVGLNFFLFYWYLRLFWLAYHAARQRGKFVCAYSVNFSLMWRLMEETAGMRLSRFLAKETLGKRCWEICRKTTMDRVFETTLLETNFLVIYPYVT